MTKMTYAQAFSTVLSTIKGIEGYDSEVIEKMTMALERENKPKAQTKVQKANEVAKPIVLDALRKSGSTTVSNLLKSVSLIEGYEDYTTSKLTAILTALKNEGSVTKVVDKKVSYYSVAE